MNPDLHDHTWITCGTSLLWDAAAPKTICPFEAVRSLRELLRLHQANWPDGSLNLINNRTLVVAGLEAAMDTLQPDAAVEWLEQTVYQAVLDFQENVADGGREAALIFWRACSKCVSHKALKYFSRHYGQVFIEKDRPFTIREALVGINNLLDDDTGTASGPEAPPPNAEPYTRQFFRIFYETMKVPRDQMQKFLRGTGIAPSDFEDRGWCSEKNKTFTFTPPVELALAWKGAARKGMARDFDQSMFLVGACVDGSGIRVEDTLNSPNFAPHPATGDLVDWLCRHGGSQEIKHGAQRARTIYRDWLSKNKRKVEEQMRLFDLEG